MSGSMFEAVKTRIKSKLASERQGVDVRVFVDQTPYGVWIWDEDETVHVQMKNQELLKALGPSENLAGYLSSLEEYRVTWSDVLGEPADHPV